MGTPVNIYPGTRGTQEMVNTAPSGTMGGRKVNTNTGYDIPILPSVSAWSGFSVPVLIALGVLALFLIERYD